MNEIGIEHAASVADYGCKAPLKRTHALYEDSCLLNEVAFRHDDTSSTVANPLRRRPHGTALRRHRDSHRPTGARILHRAPVRRTRERRRHPSRFHRRNRIQLAHSNARRPSARPAHAVLPSERRPIRSPTARGRVASALREAMGSLRPNRPRRGAVDGARFSWRNGSA